MMPARPSRDPVRVTMYVYNDVTRDSRVLREAASLAAAGYAVTVVGRTHEPFAPNPTVEHRDGFTILRVPIPARSRSWQGWVLRPRRSRRRLVRRLRTALRGLPRTAARVPLALGLLAATGAWAVGRETLNAATARTPADRDAADWLLRWSTTILGWNRRAARLGPPADVHHAHDLTGLAAAVAAARRDGARVVYDSHEVYLESGSNAPRPAWAKAILARYERRLARSVDLLVSVNRPVAAILSERLGLARAVVVHNCPSRTTFPAGPTGRLRAVIGLDADVPLVLYHGGFSAHRGLEELAAALLQPRMEDVHLAFLGYGSMQGELASIAADPRYGGRIHVLDAVPPEELLDWVSDADVGAMPIQPSTLNHRLATPNKLFECLGAGVPVVASDLAGMRAVVQDPGGPVGELCDPRDPASIATATRRILDLEPGVRAALRARCRQVARLRWSWEGEVEGLLDAYAALAGPPSVPEPTAARVSSAA